jgi:sodium/bile acid cotransporter 7
MLLASITSPSLADGLLIASALPMTPNMAIVFTATARGDEAVAVFNSAISNLMGVFVTPSLVLMYLGQENSIDIVNVFVKLIIR